MTGYFLVGLIESFISSALIGWSLIIITSLVCKSIDPRDLKKQDCEVKLGISNKMVDSFWSFCDYCPAFF